MGLANKPGTGPCKDEDGDQVAVLMTAVEVEMYENALSQFKTTNWTQVGRGVTKHPNVLGINPPKDQVLKVLKDKFGSEEGINKAAADALKNIMTHGNKSFQNTKNFGDVTNFTLDSGIGARFSSDTNSFIGFLGRGK